MELCTSTQYEGMEIYDLSITICCMGPCTIPQALIHWWKHDKMFFTLILQLMFIVHNRSWLHSGLLQLSMCTLHASFREYWQLEMIFLNLRILSIPSWMPALNMLISDDVPLRCSILVRFLYMFSSWEVRTIRTLRPKPHTIVIAVPYYINAGTFRTQRLIWSMCEDTYSSLNFIPKSSK